MRIRPNQLMGLIFVGLSLNASASVLYVNLNSTNPTPPYAGWPTAATNIQDAIDAAVDDDLVLVTNGVYQSGGRVVYGSSSNRVVINKAITVQSVNGPVATTIQGGPTTYTNGILSYGMRCVYLTNNACLSGFGLTNGAAVYAVDQVIEGSGGGAWCESTNCLLVNCLFAWNNAYQYGGAAYGGTLSNCMVFSNSAYNGGGAYGGVLYGCCLSSNYAHLGGGAYNSTLNGCTLVSNVALVAGAGANGCNLTNCTVALNVGLYSMTGRSTWAGANGGGVANCTAGGCLILNNGCVGFGSTGNNGGGAYNSTLTDCQVLANGALFGGGAYGCVMTNCTVSGNQVGDWVAATFGGGVANSTLYNCQVTGNLCDGIGGGGYGGSFYNCLICSNSGSWGCSGACSATLINCTIVGHTNTIAVAYCLLTNCIVYYNASNYDAFTNYSSLSDSCTSPLPPGSGNFTSAPLFLDLVGGNFRLQSNSPCINSGNNAYVTSTSDLDGNPRIQGGTVDMGAYEFQNPTSIISYAWLQQYGLPTDGSADFIDSDGDGMNNWQEWIAGTNPTNPSSVLKMLVPSNSIAGPTITWESISNIAYYLQRSTNLLLQPAFSTIQSNLVGQAGTTTFTDATATNSGPYFYRVGVQQ